MKHQHRFINWDGYKEGAHAHAHRNKRDCARPEVVVGACGNSPDLLFAEDLVQVCRHHTHMRQRRDKVGSCVVSEVSPCDVRCTCTSADEEQGALLSTLCRLQPAQ